MNQRGKYEQYTDDELIAEYQATGRNETVGVLYQRYGHLALGLCLRYLKNKDEAREAVLQIFEKLLSDLKKYRISFFKSWLFVYCRNFCLMELRKRQSRLKKELEIQENNIFLMDSSDPEHLNEKEKQIELLQFALEQLSPDQKTCIRLFYFDNRSYLEITGITGFSSNEVKSYIQNGKRNLKLRLEALMNAR